jgi:hypothetical protein
MPKACIWLTDRAPASSGPTRKGYNKHDLTQRHHANLLYLSRKKK